MSARRVTPCGLSEHRPEPDAPRNECRPMLVGDSDVMLAALMRELGCSEHRTCIRSLTFSPVQRSCARPCNLWPPSCRSLCIARCPSREGCSLPHTPRAGIHRSALSRSRLWRGPAPNQALHTMRAALGSWVIRMSLGRPSWVSLIVMPLHIRGAFRFPHGGSPRTPRRSSSAQLHLCRRCIRCRPASSMLPTLQTRFALHARPSVL